MVAGIIVFSYTKKSNIDLKQHEHYIKNGEIDCLVIITQDFDDTKSEQLSKWIVAINHHDLQITFKAKKFSNYEIIGLILAM